VLRKSELLLTEWVTASNPSKNNTGNRVGILRRPGQACLIYLCQIATLGSILAEVRQYPRAPTEITFLSNYDIDSTGKGSSPE
jgi:hypothetical protein